MPVLRVVARDEIRQILEPHRLLLQRVVDVGAVIVVPDLFGPRVRAGFAVVEEDHIRLDAMGIEDAGGQAQDGVQVGVLQQLAPDRLPGPALEQHVVRHDHGGAPGGLEHACGYAARS